MKVLEPKDFPKRLLEITDPPEKLYLQGTLPPEDHKWLCVVGSRRYTSYGKEACEKLIEGLRGYPIVIVSGLALGIDALAHRSALSTKLLCVAIPGSGLDQKVLYPSVNRRLAGEILAAGGALLSEFEPDFRPTQYSFPQRNRIMAGLSDAVLIVEAELKSGTLITSKFATEYNRDVLTIPGSIFSRTSAGPHMLIRLGATPVTSSNDLLQALGFDLTKHSTLNANRYDGCSPEELLVITILAEPHLRDDLIEKLNLPISRAQAILSMMEIKGLIKESMGEIHIS